MEARRWEYMSHGYFNTRYHWGYSPEEEREVIEHSKATHLRLTGRKLRGWFSPAVSNTLNTPDIVKEAGLAETLSGKGERDRTSHQIALDLREPARAPVRRLRRGVPRGRLARGSSRARQPRHGLRRQPHHDRWRHRDHVHR